MLQLLFRLSQILTGWCTRIRPSSALSASASASGYRNAGRKVGTRGSGYRNASECAKLVHATR